jgi:DNA-binding MarR family transcriptional regulator
VARSPVIMAGMAPTSSSTSRGDSSAPLPPGESSSAEFDDQVLAIERAWYLVVRLSSSNAMHDAILNAAGLEFDRSAYPLLASLAELGPLRIRQLADEVHLNPSTVSRQLVPLEEAGLIVRTTDDMDARASLIGLSRKGTKVLTKIREARHRMLLSLLDDGWTLRDRNRLESSLTRLADRLSGLVGTD